MIWEGIILMGNRIELAIGWWGGYDGYDLAALTVLSHGPAVSVSVYWGEMGC
jgi:hypothetical protein